MIDDASARGHAEPRQWKKVGVARVLWIAWAIVVWNVVFDHIVVVGGRDVIRAAGLAATTALNIDQFMRPAVTQALWTATTAASAILLIGLSAVHLVQSR